MYSQVGIDTAETDIAGCKASEIFPNLVDWISQTQSSYQLSIQGACHGKKLLPFVHNKKHGLAKKPLSEEGRKALLLGYP